VSCLFDALVSPRVCGACYCIPGYTTPRNVFIYILFLMTFRCKPPLLIHHPSRKFSPQSFAGTRSNPTEKCSAPGQRDGTKTSRAGAGAYSLHNNLRVIEVRKSWQSHQECAPKLARERARAKFRPRKSKKLYGLIRRLMRGTSLCMSQIGRTPRAAQRLHLAGSARCTGRIITPAESSGAAAAKAKHIQLDISRQRRQPGAAALSFRLLELSVPAAGRIKT
jgi:hypothetical protein